LVKNSSRTAATNHPAEHGIEFDVVMAVPHSLERGNQGRFPLPVDHSASCKGLVKIANTRVMAIVIFHLDLYWVHLNF
jgi:hypothetical protein